MSVGRMSSPGGYAVNSPLLAGPVAAWTDGAVRCVTGFGRGRGWSWLALWSVPVSSLFWCADLLYWGHINRSKNRCHVKTADAHFSHVNIIEINMNQRFIRPSFLPFLAVLPRLCGNNILLFSWSSNHTVLTVRSLTRRWCTVLLAADSVEFHHLSRFFVVITWLLHCTYLFLLNTYDPRNLTKVKSNL